METLYTYCAAIGGSLLVGQMLLSMLGFGGHGDLDGGHDVGFHGDVAGLHADAHADHPDGGGHWFVGMLSFRAIVTALAVFGLVGLGFNRQYQPPRPAATFLIALAAGGAMMYAVAWLLRSLHQLKSDGTVRIERSVGLSGSAYLTIPANKAGIGKVTVRVQDRLMEYTAVTAGDEIPTGATVVVLGVLTDGTVEVARANSSSDERSVLEQPVEGDVHV